MVIPGACVCEVYPPPVPCLRYIVHLSWVLVYICWHFGCSVCTTDLGSFMTHIFREGDHTHDVLKCGKQYGGRSRTLVCRHHTWSGRRRAASARNLWPSLTSLLTASQGCLPTFRGQQRQMTYISSTWVCDDALWTPGQWSVFNQEALLIYNLILKNWYWFWLEF